MAEELLDMEEAEKIAKRYVKKKVDEDTEIKTKSTRIKRVGKDISVYEVDGEAKITKDPLHIDHKTFSIQVGMDGEVIGADLDI